MRALLAPGFGLAVVLAGTAGHARQEPPKGVPNPAELLIQLDANNDMIVEPSEVPERARPAFEKLLALGDDNKDGKLQVEEVRGLLRKLREGAPGAGGAAMRDRFEAMDANKDGKVSRDEFRGPAEAFDRLDANKDGFVDATELTRGALGMLLGAGGAPALERLKQMDANKDARVTREEFQGPQPLFDRLDANGDGAITADEARALAGPGAPPPGAPEFPALRILEQLKEMDANGDGAIARDEFKGPAPLFDRIDADSNGTITREEVGRFRDDARRRIDAARKKAEPDRRPEADKKKADDRREDAAKKKQAEARKDAARKKQAEARKDAARKKPDDDRRPEPDKKKPDPDSVRF